MSGRCRSLSIRVMSPSVLLVCLVSIASDRHVMGDYANSRAWSIITWVTIGILIVLTIAMFVLQALGY